MNVRFNTQPVFNRTSHNNSRPVQLTYCDIWLLMILSQYFRGDWDLFMDYFRVKANCETNVGISIRLS